MRNKIAAATIAIVFIAGSAYWTSRPDSVEQVKTPDLFSKVPVVPQMKAADQVRARPRVLPPQVIDQKKPADIPVPFASELAEYRAIRNKVFMSETEKILRKSFLNNTQMLIALGGYLNTPSATTGESEDARNVATDLLLEAVQKENSEVAAKALQEVISDQTIENDEMDADVRKSLAGTKAEVLYYWSAMDAAKSEQMHSWLPGPVSEKIWQNVRQAQNQNLAESKEIRK
ncbi:MAG: hypothetical protein H7326_01100 [Bdellovibrionaceae bacterium]|nr:hypothetical protein [Pseudobdellovibrionaceae bacterium]